MMASFPSVVILISSLMLLPTLIDGSCSVCGPGLTVGKPDGIFAFPGQPMLQCSALENAGEEGLLPLDQCYFLPSLIMDVCGCAPDVNDTPNEPVCNVCGIPGYRVIDGYGIVQVPRFTPQLCSQVERQAALGVYAFDDALCGLFPALMDQFCSGCSDASLPPSASPSLYFQPLDPFDDFDDFDDRDEVGEQENISDDADVLTLFAIFAFVVVGIAILICFVYAKKTERQQPATAIRNTEITHPATVPEISDTKLAENTKLRPLVIEALFPEQKMGAVADVDVDSPNDPANTTRSLQAPCSICLEQLGTFPPSLCSARQWNTPVSF